MLYAESFCLTEHITQCAHLNSTVNMSDPDIGCGFSLNGPGAAGPIVFYTTIDGSSCNNPGDVNALDEGAMCYNIFVDEGTSLFGS